MSGLITLAATPIGNLADASPRLVQLLRDAELIAAEDTRRTQQLCQHLGITDPAPMVAYHEHNEAQKTPQLLAQVRSGTHLVVVSDAGMPAVSDPGYRLVQAAIAEGLAITCAPGPSAVLVALTLSGLATDRFCFEGFLPRKSGARAQALRQLAAEERTQIYFEAPHRVAETLQAMAEVFGAQRQAALCRELTKKFEEIRRGSLAELIQAQQQEPARGEIVLVVAGAEVAPVDEVSAVAEVLARHREGERLKDAAAAIAEETGISRRQLYQAALAEKELQ